MDLIVETLEHVFSAQGFIVETSEHVFSAQGVKVNGRIQPLFKEGVSMWAELENKWVLNLKKKSIALKYLETSLNI